MFVALHDVLVLDGILCAFDDVVVFALEKYKAEGCLATDRLAAGEITERLALTHFMIIIQTLY